MTVRFLHAALAPKYRPINCPINCKPITVDFIIFFYIGTWILDEYG